MPPIWKNHRPEDLLAVGLSASGAASWDPPSTEELSGVFEDLEARSFLGRGAMGAVYLADDLKTGHRVALKILAPNLANDFRFVERFRSEGRILAKLDHPNVVQILRVEEGDGFLGLRLEYVEGGDLAELFQAAEELDRGEVLDLVAAVAAGVAHCHDAGVVHRDLKPSNILLDGDGRPKVIDFGLARGHLDEGLTLTGEKMGTPQYAAPEQIAGEQGDARSDVFALGVLLYEIATGALPEGTFAPLSEFGYPAKMDKFLDRALAFAPEERPADAGAFLAGLEKARRKPVLGRRQWLLLALGIASLVGMGFVGWCASRLTAPGGVIEIGELLDLDGQGVGDPAETGARHQTFDIGSVVGASTPCHLEISWSGEYGTQHGGLGRRDDFLVLTPLRRTDRPSEVGVRIRLIGWRGDFQLEGWPVELVGGGDRGEVVALVTDGKHWDIENRSRGAVKFSSLEGSGTRRVKLQGNSTKGKAEKISWIGMSGKATEVSIQYGVENTVPSPARMLVRLSLNNLLRN